MEVAAYCNVLALVPARVERCKQLAPVPCAVLGMTCDMAPRRWPVSVRTIPVSGATWDDFTWNAWHGVWDAQRHQWTPALTTIDVSAGCAGGRSMGPTADIDVQLANVQNPALHPWIALRYAGIVAELRSHEFHHVRIYEAYLPSLVVSMTKQETCDAAFRLSVAVLDAMEPINALLDQEHRDRMARRPRRK